MGIVIGNQGTPDDRLLSWNTMLLLRKSIAWQESTDSTKFKACLDQEKGWYKEEFASYTRAA